MWVQMKMNCLETEGSMSVALQVAMCQTLKMRQKGIYTEKLVFDTGRIAEAPMQNASRSRT